MDVNTSKPKAGDVSKGIKGSNSLNELPQNVQDAYKGYDGVGWRGNYKGQTSGTAAGGKWDNKLNKLPNKDVNGNKITYKEYDINPPIPDVGRDNQRFVRGSDGSTYYTNDHYETFIQIK